jgi:hypothetical protein
MAAIIASVGSDIGTSLTEQDNGRHPRLDLSQARSRVPDRAGGLVLDAEAVPAPQHRINYPCVDHDGRLIGRSAALTVRLGTSGMDYRVGSPFGDIPRKSGGLKDRHPTPQIDADGVAKSDAGDHMKCPACGQWFDMRDVGHVIEHIHDGPKEPTHR